VFYYWGPSGLYGKIAEDVIMLEEAPYDEAKWSELQNSDSPTVATAYPNAPVHKGANAAFAEKAPKLIEILKAYSLSTEATSKAISYMDDENADADETAAWWLANNDAWKSWVTADVAAKVEASL
jgi:glycine betaine/proline transport system substrate-binding protein